MPYSRRHGARNDLEEALANAYAYKGRYPAGTRALIQAFMKKQPSGYRDFGSYRMPASFVEGLGRLGAELTENPVPVIRQLLFDFNGTVAVPWDIPLYLVPCARPGTMYFVTAVPDPRPTEMFSTDLRGLPADMQRRVTKTIETLRSTTQHRSLNFEKLKNCDTVFSCRVSGAYRITLRPNNGVWELLRVGKHEDVYRRPM